MPKFRLTASQKFFKENVPFNEQADNAVFISLEDLEAAAEDRSKLDPRLSDPNVQVITT